MDIGNQQRVIIVEPIDIDEVLVAEQVEVERSRAGETVGGEAAEGSSIASTLQTD